MFPSQIAQRPNPVTRYSECPSCQVGRPSSCPVFGLRGIARRLFARRACTRAEPPRVHREDPLHPRRLRVVPATYDMRGPAVLGLAHVVEPKTLRAGHLAGLHATQGGVIDTPARLAAL